MQPDDLREDFKRLSFFALKNEHVCVRLTNWGARMLAFSADGVNLLYGPRDAAELAEDSCYCGAICGRVANRIAGGCFELGGQEYRLATNNGANHLHGGYRGFDSRLWKVEEHSPSQLVMSLFSPAGEEGYPGSVKVRVSYRLSVSRLELQMEAVSDAPTLLNLTNHAYWNLEGSGTVDGHRLCVHAEKFTPMVSNIPTGAIVPVEGSPFDFREERLLNCALDDNFVLSTDGALRVVAQLRGGRHLLTVSTDAPGLQVYTGDYLPHPRGGVALEAQSFPDTPHHANFPSIVLLPGDTWHRTIAWEISSSIS